MKPENGYKHYISRYIEQLPTGIPISTEEIVSLLIKEFMIDNHRAKKIVNTNMNRLNGNFIKRYKKGIYYKAKMTPFGMSPLNPAQVILKLYLRDSEGNVIGYETGNSLLHQMGLTTQIPKYSFIATNKMRRNENKIIEDLKLVLRKPRETVTIENVRYLQLLDAIDNEDRININAKNPSIILNDYMVKNQLDFRKLVAIARKSYDTKTLLQIADLAVETRL